MSKDKGKIKKIIDKLVDAFPGLTREQAYAMLRNWRE
jgi:hypothetical protein